MHRLISQPATRIGLNALLVIFAFTCIFPVIWMMYSSLKTPSEFNLSSVRLPADPQFDNYLEAIVRGKMGLYFLNSLYNSVMSVVIVIVIALITGYFISRFRFPGRNVLYLFFVSGMLLPIYALLIPIFVEFRAIGLYDTRFALVFPYIAFELPIALFLVESFVQSIPREVEEAAYIDGSTLSRTLFTIILPMCTPIMSTIVILAFLNTWNEFPLALVLISKSALRTIPVGLTNFSGEHTTDYPQMMAALVIASVPVILIYLVFNRSVIKGMISGSVKG